MNEYIKQTYGSLLRFIQDNAHEQEFKLTEDKHVKFCIDCVQRPNPTRVHPEDITPLVKDTTSIMHLNLQKWYFPSKNKYAKIFEKYKEQVGFPKDFIWEIERHKDVTVVIGRLNVTRTRLSSRIWVIRHWSSTTRPPSCIRYDSR